MKNKVLDTQIKECTLKECCHDKGCGLAKCQLQEPKECGCEAQEQGIKHTTDAHGKPQPLEWEEEPWATEFDNLTKDVDLDTAILIADLIRNLLSLERKKIVEQVEGMKIPHKIEWGAPENIFKRSKAEAIRNVIDFNYNRALSDVLDILKGKGGANDK